MDGNDVLAWIFAALALVFILAAGFCLVWMVQDERKGRGRDRE